MRNAKRKKRAVAKGCKMKQDELIDCRGLLCPLPVLRVARHIRLHAHRHEFVIWVTDPAALQDIPTWALANDWRYQIARSSNCDVVSITKSAEDHKITLE
jgi:TusA-related sulfurtransferase